MLKKRIALLGVAAVFVCAIMIPSVRGAAESALSVFRVGETKTITISVSDVQELMTFAQKEGAAAKSDAGTDLIAEGGGMQAQLMEKMKEQVKTLTNTSEFTAFSFSLPTSLKAETPRLTAVGAQSETMTLDTAKINDALTKLGAAGLVDASYNGAAVTVNTPPVIVAEYADVTLAATQNVVIDAPDGAADSLWSALLSIPAIPEDLRTQLAAIDPKTRDIYLPVIEGLGRETDLGSVTGYIYTSGDLASVLGTIPGLSGDAMNKQLQDENASVLIWTKNGVLYCLAGAVSDSALTQIARSIR
jgi:hypothetical protein